MGAVYHKPDEMIYYTFINGDRGFTLCISANRTISSIANILKEYQEWWG